MKFQVNRDVLNEAVSFAARMLPQRITNQILGGILIDADQDVLRFSVFDYEVSAQVEISAKVSEPGSVLVSGRLLSEITSKLPAAPVEFETDGSKVIVTCGSSKFSLLTMAVEGYPNLPEIPEQTGQRLQPGGGHARRAGRRLAGRARAPHAAEHLERPQGGHVRSRS